jgi:DNA polymerase I-like protein with 3'-5' exonuclease and polymerase domains
MAFDTEATGLSYPKDRAIGFSIALPCGFAEYWDIREQPEALRWLQNALSTYKGLIIGWNIKYDFLMMVPYFKLPITQLDDAAIREVLIDEHRSTPFPWKRKRLDYTLDSVAETRLGKRKDTELYREMAAIFGGLPTRNVQMPRIADAPSSIVRPYAVKDAQLTLKIWEDQEADIEGQDLYKVCKFERDTIPHVIETEMAGVRVDLDAAERAMDGLQLAIEMAQARLSHEVGHEFNANSTPQIRDYFQPKLVKGRWFLGDGTPCGSTPKGNPSIDNDVLQSIKNKSPVAASIIDIRSLIRTRNTFLAKHILGHEINGRVYPTINQVASERGGTKWGRFSYVDPALQQIPSRNKAVAKIVKACFLPDEDQWWLDADLEGFEVRTFAHLVAAFNRALVRAYENDPNTSFHTWVAELMGVPRNPTPTGGANAKQLNLSMIFNSGPGAIAHKLGLPTTPDMFTDPYGQDIHFRRAGPEAMEVINKYHRKIQGVRELADACKDKAEQRGYIVTKYGRRLRFPRKFKSYKASGILIQATAADINKENWGIIKEVLGDRGRLILNTHDSYSMSVDPAQVRAVWKDVKHAIQRDILRVPLKLDLNGVGRNWWEAVGGH